MTERDTDKILVSKEEYDRLVQWGMIDETKNIQMNRGMRRARSAWLKIMEQEG